MSRASRRTWRSRLVLGTLASLTILGLAATAVSAYVLVQLGRIERHELAEVLTSAPQRPVTAADVVIGEESSVGPDGGGEADGSVGPDGGGEADGSVGAGAGGNARQDGADSGAAGQLVRSAGSGGENYLLVGIDNPLGLEPDDPLRAGHSDLSRLADVIMVVRLREDGTAAMMSIPRDYAARISGTATSSGALEVAKINSAYNRDATAAGRAARLIDTIEENFDITLQHFVEVDFEAFLRLVDAVGGVVMSFDRPLRDQPKDPDDPNGRSRSGFETQAGTRLLDGRAALAYVRSRHLEAQASDGAWQPFGVWNDIDRNSRQREFLRTAASQLAPGLTESPARLLAVLDIAADHLATSDTLSIVADGPRLANRFGGIDPDENLTDYELRMIDVHDPVRWSLALDPAAEKHNRRTLDIFRGIGWDDVVESRVTVRVSGENRAAVAAQLRQVGFQTEVAPTPPAGIEPPSGRNVIYLSSQGRLAAGLLASRLVPLPAFACNDDLSDSSAGRLDATTVMLHLGGDDPRVDDEHRRVSVPCEAEPAA